MINFKVGYHHSFFYNILIPSDFDQQNYAWLSWKPI